MTQDQLLARLSDDDPAAPLAVLCRLGVDHVLDQPIETLVDPERLRALITRAVTGPGLELALERHIRPAIERALARAEARKETLGDWVPDDVVHELGRLLATPWRVDPKMIREAVQGEATKAMIATMVREALALFARSAGSAGGGLGGSLFGLVGKGAGVLRDAGKGLLGGLGDELERQFQKRANDVLDLSMSVLQDKLVDFLLSEETARSFGKARAQVFRATLKRKVAEARELPIDALLGVLPRLVRYNLGREEVQAILAEEIAAALKVDGARPLRTVLGEAGILDQVRDELIAKARTQARALVQTDAFAAWLAALLAPAA